MKDQLENSATVNITCACSDTTCACTTCACGPACPGAGCDCGCNCCK
ncbi:MAG: hypothetical protein ABI432_11335 [Flavobacteriales bacterium]